jgi:hypothetical protein
MVGVQHAKGASEKTKEMVIDMVQSRTKVKEDKMKERKT